MCRLQTLSVHLVPRTVGVVSAFLMLAGAIQLLPLAGSTDAEGAIRQLDDDPAGSQSVPLIPVIALQPAMSAMSDAVDAHAAAIHPAARPEGRVVDALDAAAAAHGIHTSLLRAVAWTESSFRPTARSHAGAVGIMQLMPRTITHVEELLGRSIDPLVVADNVDGGAAYLAYLLGRADGDTRLALAAYHEGWTGVVRDGASSTSAAYAQRVLDLRAQLVADLA